MPEDQGNITVEEKQPSAVPTENQTPESTEETGLPEDVSDRTREQFEKLTQHNKQLAEELRQLRETRVVQPDEGIDVFNPLVPPPKMEMPQLPNIPGLSPQQTQDEYDKLVDKDGYIDEKLLKEELKHLKEEVKRAKEEAKAAKDSYIRDRENEQLSRTYKKFPQLNPNNKDVFNPDFYELVKDKALSQMVRTGTRDIFRAAEDAAKIMSIQDVSLQKAQDTSRKEEQVKQINQTGTAVNRAAPPAYNKADESYLSKRTMAGDQDAVLERLRRMGI